MWILNRNRRRGSSHQNPPILHIQSHHIKLRATSSINDWMFFFIMFHIYKDFYTFFYSNIHHVCMEHNEKIVVHNIKTEYTLIEFFIYLFIFLLLRKWFFFLFFISYERVECCCWRPMSRGFVFNRDGIWTCVDDECLYK